MSCSGVQPHVSVLFNRRDVLATAASVFGQGLSSLDCHDKRKEVTVDERRKKFNVTALPSKIAHVGFGAEIQRSARLRI